VIRAAIRVVAICVAALAPLRAQAPNDACAGAVPITGSPLVASNAGATTGPDPIPSCSSMTGDVWFSFVPPCTGTYTASTCAAPTTFGTVVAIWDGTGGCGALAEIACSDLCSSGAFLGASAAAVLNAGQPYFISVGGTLGITGTFGLSVTLGAAMTLSFFSSGSGTLGYVITGGPATGTAFVALTAHAGSFPLGWFYGVDLFWSELIYEISVGFPFITTLQPCGLVAVGPYPGLPSGLTLYGVALGLPLGGTIPVAFTLPVVGVVP
jgi:hypothetical protein